MKPGTKFLIGAVVIIAGVGVQMLYRVLAP